MWMNEREFCATFLTMVGRRKDKRNSFDLNRKKMMKKQRRKEEKNGKMCLNDFFFGSLFVCAGGQRLATDGTTNMPQRFNTFYEISFLLSVRRRVFFFTLSLDGVIFQMKHKSIFHRSHFHFDQFCATWSTKVDTMRVFGQMNALTAYERLKTFYVVISPSNSCIGALECRMKSLFLSHRIKANSRVWICWPSIYLRLRNFFFFSFCSSFLFVLRNGRFTRVSVSVDKQQKKRLIEISLLLRTFCNPPRPKRKTFSAPKSILFSRWLSANTKFSFDDYLFLLILYFRLFFSFVRLSRLQLGQTISFFSVHFSVYFFAMNRVQSFGSCL